MNPDLVIHPDLVNINMLWKIFGSAVVGLFLIGIGFKIVNLLRKDSASVTGITSDAERIKELQGENSDLRQKLNDAWEVNTALVKDKSDLSNRITKLESKLDQCLMILKALAEEHAAHMTPSMRSMLAQVVDDSQFFTDTGHDPL